MLNPVPAACQHAEANYNNTRQCLEVLLKYHYPVLISTKSTLILRDVDILSRIVKDSWCAIGVTITTLDTKLAQFLEPKAPAPEKRLEVVKEIKTRCPEIQVGVDFIPIVPLLGDSDENMEKVTIATREAGADFILFGGGMTMRDNQAAWFMRCLKRSSLTWLVSMNSYIKVNIRRQRATGADMSPAKVI